MVCANGKNMFLAFQKCQNRGGIFTPIEHIYKGKQTKQFTDAASCAKLCRYARIGKEGHNQKRSTTSALALGKRCSKVSCSRYLTITIKWIKLDCNNNIIKMDKTWLQQQDAGMGIGHSNGSYLCGAKNLDKKVGISILCRFNVTKTFLVSCCRDILLLSPTCWFAQTGALTLSSTKASKIFTQPDNTTVTQDHWLSVVSSVRSSILCTKDP